MEQTDPRALWRMWVSSERKIVSFHAEAGFRLLEFRSRELFLRCVDRYTMEQVLAQNGLALHPFLETGNTDIITRLLLQNRGVSFLPEFVVRVSTSLARFPTRITLFMRLLLVV